jgi:hypothetical protein
MALVEQVMTQEPYTSAKRVFWIIDNGSSHRGKRAIDRLAARFPNAVVVHTPVHASWTNQIEILFSIVQRKVVSPNNLTDIDQVRDRLRGFEDRYNPAAQPFQRRFTISDLDDLLTRLDRHTHPPPDKKNPPSTRLPDQPPKNFETQPLSFRVIASAGIRPAEAGDASRHASPPRAARRRAHKTRQDERGCGRPKVISSRRVTCQVPHL